jgi:hypothetical protein
MTATDPRLAPLAAALHDAILREYPGAHGPRAIEWRYLTDAERAYESAPVAAALAALPPDWCGHTAEWIASRWTMVREEERRFWQRVLLAYGTHTEDCGENGPGCSCAWSGYEAAARAALAQAKEATDAH